jgi:hypothetical protein
MYATRPVEEVNRCHVSLLGCHLGKNRRSQQIITERNERTQSGCQSAEITVRFSTLQRDLFDEYEEKMNEKVEAQYSDDCNR